MYKSKKSYIYKTILLSILAMLTIIASVLCFFNYGIDQVGGSLLIGGSIIGFFILGSKDTFNPLAIYTVFWLGSAGLSCFRMSKDQYSWSWYMWLVVLTAYITFVIGYLIVKKRVTKSSSSRTVDVNKLYIAIVTVVILSVLALIFEILVLGYLPLLSKDMRAYKNFHISGIHYLVVSISLIPPLTMIYRKLGGKKHIIVLNVISFIVPVLIVSRQLTIFEFVVCIIAYHYLYKKIKMKFIISFSIVGMLVFSASGKLRNQNVDYIKHAARIESTSNSLLIQPYLYFAMNFENLRNIVENFDDFQCGRNMTFPILAFSNTKKYVDYSYKSDYITNENFTTSTYLSDVYFDFGYFGVLVIPFLLGMIYSLFYIAVTKAKITLNSLMDYILTYCLIFCFFMPWHFNPTIWFYFIVLIIMGLFCSKRHTAC